MRIFDFLNDESITYIDRNQAINTLLLRKQYSLFAIREDNFQLNVPKRQDTKPDQTRPTSLIFNTATGLDLGGSHANQHPHITTTLYSMLEGLVMKYVTIKKLSELIGYSEDAIRAKISQGKWRLGKHFKKAPDGRILMSIREIEKWIES